jgi:hypothetical protein
MSVQHLACRVYMGCPQLVMHMSGDVRVDSKVWAGKCWAPQTPPVHACATTRVAAFSVGVDSHTFSSICSESVKSVSMDSTSASLGALFRKRPKVLCARCIVQGGSNCVQQQAESKGNKLFTC